MLLRRPALAVTALATSLVLACASSGTSTAPAKPRTLTMTERIQQYAPFRLTTDLSALSEGERRALPHLIEAAEHMDAIFWMEAHGDRDALLAEAPDATTRRYLQLNYGPWDRLADNRPFLVGVGPKPAGAAFYPAGVTKAEIEAHLLGHREDREAFESAYTLVRRDARGGLVAVPYHEAFAEHVEAAAAALERAADVVEPESLQSYLRLRAEALRTDEYRASDMAWLDMKDNRLDVVIGPIETYEDRLYGRKAAHEAYVLVKDVEWSERLARYTEFLPALQAALPVDEAYRSETPGTDSDLNAYDVVYYAGDCNAGSKTIAINLPNDEEVQLAKGTRRLQLKNAMRAKFDAILTPIADVLIAEDQRQHVTFDAFFGNTMFHEVAHGLGIKNTLDGRVTVREALQEHASALEEGKADILGLFMVARLFEQGEIPEGEVMDNYVTFLAGIFRSVRFGASSAHGRANMIRFNFFEQRGAFTRDPRTGTYRVERVPFERAVSALTRRILTIQGDGDRAAAARLVDELGRVGPGLQADLDRLADAGIPVDIVFEQGPAVLGL